VAGTLRPTPVSAPPSALRRPVGPSESQMEGTPRRSIGTAVQASRPTVSAAFSSRVIRANTSSTRAPMPVAAV